MRRILLLVFIASMTLAAVGQSTTISSSGVVDSDGFTWKNGTYQVQFVPNPSWPSISTYVWAGGNLQQNALFTGSLDGSGAFSLSVPSNTAITPSGSQWKVTVCPNAQTGCFSINTGTVTGATQDLTAAINASAQGPRFPITNYTGYGYGTVEVNPTPLPGTEFYDTTNAVCYQFSGPPGNSWAACPNAIGVYLPLAGGTMTGAIAFSGGPNGTVAQQTIANLGALSECPLASQYGFLLNGTDESAKFNTLMQTFYNQGGGCIAIDAGKTLLLAQQITLPDSGSSPWTMPPIRITGVAPSAATADNLPAGAPVGAGTLDLTYNGGSASCPAGTACGRIVALGQGTLEIDHLNVQNSSSNCGVFIQSTLTNVRLLHDSFFGSASGFNACDDVWIAGGTDAPPGLNGTINDYFQGYASVVQDNVADQIRRLVYGRVAFNSINISGNVIWARSGSNFTQSVTAATNATQAVLTSTAHNFHPGDTFNLYFTGFTANWAAANGQQQVTVIDANTLQLNNVNSTSFGALTGTPAYYVGSAFELDGLGKFTATGDVLQNNLIETVYYPFGITMKDASHTNISGNSCWDPVNGIACIWEQNSSVFNYVLDSTNGEQTMEQTNGWAASGDTIINPSGLSAPVVMANHQTGATSRELFPNSIFLAQDSIPILGSNGPDNSTIGSMSLIGYSGNESSADTYLACTHASGCSSSDQYTWNGTSVFASEWRMQVGSGSTGFIIPPDDLPTTAEIGGNNHANNTLVWQINDDGSSKFKSVAFGGTTALTNSDNVVTYCGIGTFSSGTTSSAATGCTAITSASHCQVTWTGNPTAAVTLWYTPSAGSVVANASGSVSGTVAISCSVN